MKITMPNPEPCVIELTLEELRIVRKIHGSTKTSWQKDVCKFDTRGCFIADKFYHLVTDAVDAFDEQEK